ncbi:hypothetical protein GCM10010869_02860 [Mesorhizobium tianshanense]|uniref:Uncharacterized protein n=1 Tax=Mesorhizobium tianshanense TaxID=39844 RepID=A0A562PDC5_9HYPH|nr:hypothetical protein [Mesorhizobium tianshanense]TWI41976.1 hypothetical protein IQ26_00900 [Mesorhizobium tianshanense]GLS34698.1 hypothetical protein GCM10010869_02860 [Mesorhizobium tianshanense]
MGDVPGINNSTQLTPEQLLEKQKAHDIRMLGLKFESAMQESKQAAMNRMAEGIARASS